MKCADINVRLCMKRNANLDLTEILETGYSYTPDLIIRTVLHLRIMYIQWPIDLVCFNATDHSLCYSRLKSGLCKQSGLCIHHRLWEYTHFVI